MRCATGERLAGWLVALVIALGLCAPTVVAAADHRVTPDSSHSRATASADHAAQRVLPLLFDGLMEPAFADTATIPSPPPTSHSVTIHAAAKSGPVSGLRFSVDGVSVSFGACTTDTSGSCTVSNVPAKANCTVYPPTGGGLKFTFTPTSASCTASSDASVAVAVNYNPTISAANVTVTQWQATTVHNVTASDPGDPLTFGQTGLPGGLGMAASTGIISGTPTSAPGTFSVQATVKDDTNGFASTYFTLTVQAPAVPPPPPTPAPTIALTGSPILINPPGSPAPTSAMLAWTTTNAAGCRVDLSPNGPTNLPIDSNTTVTQATTYTARVLRCPDGQTATSNAVTIRLHQPPTATIKVTGGSTLSIIVGGTAFDGQDVTNYFVTCTTSGQPPLTLSKPKNGDWLSQTVAPGDWTCRAAVTDSMNLISPSVSGIATVTAPTKPTLTIQITPTPPTITVGQSVTLDLVTTNATSCLRDGIVAVATNAHIVESPKVSEKVHIDCSGPGGTVGQDVFITVNPAASTNQPPTLSLVYDANQQLDGSGTAQATIGLTMSDDRLPNPPGALTASCTPKTGTDTIQQLDATTYRVTLTGTGSRTVTCQVSDGALSVSRNANFVVTAAAPPPPPVDKPPTFDVTATPASLVFAAPNVSSLITVSHLVDEDPASVTVRCAAADGPQQFTVTPLSTPPLTWQAIFYQGHATKPYLVRCTAVDKGGQKAFAYARVMVQPAAPSSGLKPPLTALSIQGCDGTIPWPDGRCGLRAVTQPPCCFDVTWDAQQLPSGAPLDANHVFDDSRIGSPTATFPGPATYRVVVHVRDANTAEELGSAQRDVTVAASSQPPAPVQRFITGRVVWGQSTGGVVNATVQLASATELLQSVKTDSDGAFSFFDAFPNGIYFVQASMPQPGIATLRPVQQTVTITTKSPDSVALPAPFRAVPLAPTITPNGGTFTDQVDVTLSAKVLFYEDIHYTLDGTAPTCVSPSYQLPPFKLTLTRTTTVQAVVCLANGQVLSPVATAAFTINATAANQPPRVQFVSPHDGQAFTTRDTIAIKYTATDPDGSIADAYYWITPPSNAFLPVVHATEGTLKPADLQVGTYHITATAKDDKGDSTSVTIAFTVKAADEPPVDKAQFVSQSLKDGGPIPEKMVFGEQREVQVTMKNVGTSTWTSPAYSLIPVPTRPEWNIYSVSLPASAAPGETVTFRFTIRAAFFDRPPNISPFQWTMAKNVSPFEEPTPLVKVQLVAADPLPTARFTANRTTGFAPPTLTVQVDASASTGKTLTYAWDCDNGTTAAGVQAACAYPKPRVAPYVITLTVTDKNAKTATFSVPITVLSGTRTIAGRVIWAPGTPDAGKGVDGVALTLQASAASVPDRTVTTANGGLYQIPDAPLTAYTLTPKFAGVAFTPSSMGVSLTRSSPEPVPVNDILARPTQAPISVSAVCQPNRAQLGEQVTCDATGSTGTAPLKYGWTFDDGATDQGVVVHHSFRTTGQHTVTLTVTDKDARSASMSLTVTVSDPGPVVFLHAVPSSGPANEVFIKFDTIGSTPRTPDTKQVCFAFYSNGSFAGWSSCGPQLPENMGGDGWYYSPGTYDEQLDVTYELTNGQTIRRTAIATVHIGPARTFDINGVVKWEDGADFLDATVQLSALGQTKQPCNGQPCFTKSHTPYGVYDFYNVPLGKYLLTATFPGVKIEPEAGMEVDITSSTQSSIVYPPQDFMARRGPVPINQPPIANAGADQTIVMPAVGNATTKLDGSATDDGKPAGSTLRFLWWKKSGPGDAQFINFKDPKTNVSFTEPGDYELLLEASDGAIYGPSDTMIVHVMPTALDQQYRITGAVQGQQIVTTWQGPDGKPEDRIIFLAAGASESATLWSNQTGGAKSGTFRLGPQDWPKQTDQYEFRWMRGAQLLAKSAPFMIQPQGPLLNAAFVSQDVPSMLAPKQRTRVRVTMRNTGSVPWRRDSHRLVATTASYRSWTLSPIGLPGEAVVPGDSVDFAFEIVAPSAEGTYDFQWTMSDDTKSFGSPSQLASIAVKAPVAANQPPVVNAGPDVQLVLSPSGYVETTLQGSVKDDGLPVPPNLFIGWDSDPIVAVGFFERSNPKTVAFFMEPGTYKLHLHASDGLLQAEDEMIVTVVAGSAANKAPIANAGPDQSVLLPSSGPAIAVVDGSHSSDDNLPNPPGHLTFAWRQVRGPGSATFATALSATSTVQLLGVGDHVLQLTVSDGELSATDETIVSVVTSGATVAMPTFIPPDGKLQRPGSVLVMTMTSQAQIYCTKDGSDPSQTPSQLVTVGVVFVDRPLLLRCQAYRMGYHPSAIASLSVTLPKNTAPIVNAGSDQTLQVPPAAPIKTTVTGSASDDGQPSPGKLTYQWIARTGSGVVFDRPTEASSPVRFPGEGTYILRLTVSDGELQGYDELAVIVESMPQVVKPTFDPDGRDAMLWGPTSVVVHSLTPQAQIYCTKDDTDPTPIPALLANPSVTVDHALTLRCRGYRTGYRPSDIATSTYTWLDNHPPIVDAGSDQTVTLDAAGNAIAQLAGSARDDDPDNQLGGTPQLSQWTVRAGPLDPSTGMTADVSFSPSRYKLDATATFHVAGSYLLRLSTTDGLLTGWDEMLVTVLPAGNGPPTVRLIEPTSSTMLRQKQRVTLRAEAADPEKQALTVGFYRVSSGADPTTPVPQRLLCEVSSAAGPYACDWVMDVNAGPLTLAAKATDPGGRSAWSAPVTITVQAFTIPQVFAGVNRTIGLVPGTVTLAPQITPPGAYTLTWSKDSGPGTVSFPSGTHIAQATATFSAVGPYVLRLTVEDAAKSFSVSDTLTVAVTGSAKLTTLAVSASIGPNPDDGVGLVVVNHDTGLTLTGKTTGGIGLATFQVPDGLYDITATAPCGDAVPVPTQSVRVAGGSATVRFALTHLAPSLTLSATANGSTVVAPTGISGPSPLDVAFDASRFRTGLEGLTCTPVSGRPLDYMFFDWHFGDSVVKNGKPVEVVDQGVGKSHSEHVYPGTNKYAMSLTVVNASGGQATITMPITVITATYALTVTAIYYDTKQPAANFWIVISGFDTNEVFEVQTDAHGLFKKSGLLPGRYDVSARHDSPFYGSSTTMSIVDADVTVDLQLIRQFFVPPVPRPVQAQLLAPREGDTFDVGKAVTLAVDLNDPDRATKDLEFREGTTRVIGTTHWTDSGWTERQWTPPGAGDYTFWVRAINAAGVAVQSPTVRVHVVPAGQDPGTGGPPAPEQPPLVPPHSPKPGAVTIQIIKPANGTTIGAGETIELRATTIDATHQVQRVGFYEMVNTHDAPDSALLCETASGSPYVCSYKHTWPSGTSHSIVARAFDATGKLAESTPVRVTIAFVNRPPTVDAGPDQIAVLDQSTVAYLKSTAQDDGLIRKLTYAWSKVSGPATTFDGTPTGIAAFAELTGGAGNYEFQVTVSDGQYTASDRVLVTAVATTKHFSIGGRVLKAKEEGGGPLPGASVLIGPYPVVTTQTDSQGHFVFNDLPPGLYDIWVDHDETLAVDPIRLPVQLRDRDVDYPTFYVRTVTPPPQPYVLHRAKFAGLFAQEGVAWSGPDGDPTDYIELEKVGVGDTIWSTGTFADTSGAQAVPRSVLKALTPGLYLYRWVRGQTILASTVAVDIPEPGRPTVIVKAGADQTIESPPGQTNLRALVEPKDPTYQIVWELGSGPSDVSLADPTKAATTASFSSTGVYELRVTVSNQSGVVLGWDKLTVTVVDEGKLPPLPIGNQPPVINVAATWNATLDATGSAKVALSADVQDDGALHSIDVKWTQIDGPKDARTGRMARITFSNAQALYTDATVPMRGTYKGAIAASDGQFTVMKEFTIVVGDQGPGNSNPVTGPPAASPRPPQPPSQGPPGTGPYALRVSPTTVAPGGDVRVQLNGLDGLSLAGASRAWIGLFAIGRSGYVSYKYVTQNQLELSLRASAMPGQMLEARLMQGAATSKPLATSESITVERGASAPPIDNRKPAPGSGNPVQIVPKLNDPPIVIDMAVSYPTGQPMKARITASVIDDGKPVPPDGPGKVMCTWQAGEVPTSVTLTFNPAQQELRFDPKGPNKALGVATTVTVSGSPPGAFTAIVSLGCDDGARTQSSGGASTPVAFGNVDGPGTTTVPVKLDAEGHPVPGALAILSTTNGRAKTAVFNADGLANIRVTDADRWVTPEQPTLECQLMVVVDGAGEYRDPNPVVITRGETHTTIPVKFSQLIKPASLDLRIVDQAGDPLANALVFFDGGFTAWGQTDAGGNVHMQVNSRDPSADIPGTLSIQRRFYADDQLSLSLRRGETRQVTVRLSFDGQQIGGPQISGKVLFGTRAAAGAMIFVNETYDDGHMESWTSGADVVADSDGEFVVYTPSGENGVVYVVWAEYELNGRLYRSQIETVRLSADVSPVLTLKLHPAATGPSPDPSKPPKPPAPSG